MADDKDLPGDPATAVRPPPEQSRAARSLETPGREGEITPDQGEMLYTEELEGAGLPAGPGDDHGALIDFRTGSHQRFEVSVAIEQRRDEAAAARSVREAEDNVTRSMPPELTPTAASHGPTSQDLTEGEREARRRRDELDTANDNQIEPAPELAALHGLRPADHSPPESPEWPSGVPERPDTQDRQENAPGGSQEPVDEPAERGSNPGRSRPETEARRWSTQRGDVPEEITARYVVETGRTHAFYFDHRQREAAFQDAGNRLHTQANAPRVIADMVEVAKHRGWSEIQVRGSAEFRQEAWLEARAAGLDVRGYNPSQRDLQELERRRTPGQNTLSPTHDRERGASTEHPMQGADNRGPSGANGRPAPSSSGDRINYQEGVTGRILETGSAPYQNREGARSTPYITLELAGGRQERVWGVDLPGAMRRSGKGVGDDVTVRKEGVQTIEVNVPRSDPVNGKRIYEKAEVPRNTWAVEAADRFRTLSASERARDPDLKAAQSQFTAISARLSDDVRDPKVRTQVLAELRENIAQGLAEGQTFKPAMMQEAMAHTREQDRQLDTPTRSTPERER